MGCNEMGPDDVTGDTIENVQGDFEKARGR